MTYEEAEKLLLEHEEQFNETKLNELDSLFRAIEIIKKYDKNGSYHAEHDELWIGGFSEDTTREEILELNELGFRLDCDSWCTFC